MIIKMMMMMMIMMMMMMIIIPVCRWEHQYSSLWRDREQIKEQPR